MARTRQVTVTGVKELKRMVTQVSPKVAHQIARQAVHATAGKVRTAMRRRVKAIAYDDGTLYKAIHTKRRRGTPTEAVSDVRISHGKGVKNDAWYWHFIEFGTKKIDKREYIRPTVTEYESQIPRIYTEEFGKKLEKRLEKEAKKQR